MTADILTFVLGQPERLKRLSLADWDLLIRQARRAQLLARLERICAGRGWLADIPPGPHRHLEAARYHCERQHCEVRWEVDRIRSALASVETPIVLLKGAAYVVAGLPPASGRLFADIDIMVPRGRLAEVETALGARGWVTQAQDSYDQRYYRTWMHELPPLRHVTRGTMLDVHHTITPPTSRAAVDADKLFAAARPIDAGQNLLVLSPVDMVLHSAAHLFQEGEFDHGLRDLVDFDDLLRDFGRDLAFWPSLADRAAELGLGRPLYYAMQHARRILSTSVPGEFAAALDRYRPGPLAGRAMAASLRIALKPDHPACNGYFTPLARGFLYLRAHYLRMPLNLLVPHLVRKALISDRVQT